MKGWQLHYYQSMKELEKLLTFIGKLEPEALLLRPTGRAGSEDRLTLVWS